MKTTRLLPLVALAALCLLIMKAIGLFFGNEAIVSGQQRAAAQEKPAETKKNAQTHKASGAKKSDQKIKNPLPDEGVDLATQSINSKQPNIAEQPKVERPEEEQSEISQSEPEQSQTEPQGAQGSVFDENFVNESIPPNLSIINDQILFDDRLDLPTSSVNEEKSGDAAQNNNQAADENKPSEGAETETKNEAANSSQQKITSGPEAGPTKSEFAVLQSLSKRRKELEARERQLDLQKNLLKAAEKRVESRISELKSIEDRIRQALKRQEEVQSAQYGKLVQIYSRMKPNEAARIFNRLNLDVLLGLVQRIKPKTMSPILAAMDPAQVERLTLEMASKAQTQDLGNKTLPKINSN